MPAEHKYGSHSVSKERSLSQFIYITFWVCRVVARSALKRLYDVNSSSYSECWAKTDTRAIVVGDNLQNVGFTNRI